jgi:hypothetical protein
MIESINPQLITGIKGGFDTEIEFDSIEDTANDFSIIREDSSTPTDDFNEYNQLITISQTPKQTSKRKQSITCTQTYAEEMLKLEKEKLELKKKKIKLMKINLILKAKDLENRGLDVSQELLELSETCDNI